MPQASDELRKAAYRFFGTEDTVTSCLDYLRMEGYTEKNGWISPPPGQKESPRYANLAIAYLVHEWDYAFKEKP